MEAKIKIEIIVNDIKTLTKLGTIIHVGSNIHIEE